jgi:hypothetical protein
MKSTMRQSIHWLILMGLGCTFDVIFDFICFTLLADWNFVAFPMYECIVFFWLNEFLVFLLFLLFWYVIH